MVSTEAAPAAAHAEPTAPTEPAAQPAATLAPIAVVRRLGRSTPGLLALFGVGLILALVIAGVVGTAAVQSRSNDLSALVTEEEPLATAAQDLYGSLSDADATAAGAFLAGGGETAAVRSRYTGDLAVASTALVTASGAADASSTAAVAEIAAQLPSYAGLVETARANNRAGLPLGAAYLREASNLLQARLLPTAQRLYTDQAAVVTQRQQAAASFPWIAVLLGLLTVIALVLVQRQLARRTNRTFSIGLLLATVATLGWVVWLAIAAGVAGSRTDASRSEGSAVLDGLVRARIAAQQARSDETLTLVARGDGAAYEKSFMQLAAQLDDGSNGGLLGSAAAAADPAIRDRVNTAVTATRAWFSVHKQLRAADDAGNYDDAVGLAIGTDPASAGSRFTAADTALRDAIELARQRFADRAESAQDALRLLVPGVVILSVLSIAGVVAGLWPRLREYQ